MYINRKIEEIRQKPEHIRMRYVWLMMAISMLLIISIWIFSFKSNIESSPSDKAILPDFKNALESQKQELPSIQSFIDNNSSANGSEEGAVSNNNASNQANPSEESTNSPEDNSNNSTPEQ
jgi:hypothetical protein